MSDLPRLLVIAENEIEWRALQLFIRLMEYGKTGITAEYSPEGEKDEE